ncbi:carboxypeptidase-like regulatory domain-containing protein [Robertkochia marina]|nr:carboxypeptidase-like regulatory domain-containing protein [Robertkochia marina]
MLFISVAFSYGQQTVRGIVTDMNTGKHLPFASVNHENAHLGVTDMTGNFTLQIPENATRFTVTYPGYLPKTVSVAQGKILTITLQKHPSSNIESQIKSNIAAANSLMEKVIRKKKDNYPENILDSYTFRSYQKSVITAHPDSINDRIDSIFRKQKNNLVLRKVDSSNYFLKQQLLRTHLYLIETSVKVDYSSKEGRKETIVANQMAGLEEPLYRLLKFQLQSFSIYKESYTLLGTTYKSPLAGNALKTYNYRVIDTVLNEGRPAFLVYFYPKRTSKKAQLKGALYIDTVSLALQKGHIQHRNGLDISARQDYTYFEEENIWFPTQAKLNIKKGDGDKPVDLFDRMIIEVNEPSSDSKLIHTNNDFPDKQIRYTAEQYNTDIAFNIPVTIEKRAKDIRVAPNAFSRQDPFWNLQRSAPLTLREYRTYNELDSIAIAQRINERFAFLSKLFTGYLSTRYIDFDLKYLLKYNNYEAFRLGMGAITNDNFSKRFRLKAYGVYGTKDAEFKYGATGSYKLLPTNETWIGVDYKDDLVETGSDKFITDGRTFYVFEPRLFNITSFHRNKAVSTYFQHEINPALRIQLQWSHIKTDPTYPYTYLYNQQSFDNYTTNTGTFSLYWAPNNTYLTFRDSNSLLSPGFPQFNLQFTQGLKGVMGSDFGFTKTQLRIRHRINTFGAGAIDLNMTGGLAFGDLPITELYHASPNQPKAQALLSRFSVAGRDSFETMYFDEFFSDRYLSLQAKYLAPPFKISDKITPQVSFITRFAIGDIRNPENHIGIPFQSLKEGYYESGLEFNNIFSGFGLSTMYRYGPYNLPLFTDNISLKFTFYLSLGI